MPTINYFKHATDFVEYSAGTVIFEQGDDCFDMPMYAVHEGEIDIFVHNKLLETVGEGGIFGKMTLVDQAARSARAVAKTDCKVVPVDKDRFLFMVQETPTFALQVMHLMAERLRKMNALV